jgi:hypothetical protein
MRRRRMNQSQSSSSKEGMKISQRRQQATATFLHPRLRYKYEFRLVGFKVNLTDATQNWRWSSANCDTVSLQYQWRRCGGRCVSILDRFGLAPSVVVMCVWWIFLCVFLACNKPALLFAAALFHFNDSLETIVTLPCFLFLQPAQPYLVS